MSQFLKAYVYELSDPSNGDVFYIGKGRGNRVFQHAQAASSRKSMDIDEPKLDRIREIHRRGDDVKVRIVRHGLDDQTALEIEAVLIEQQRARHPELLKNLVSGHGLERGAMSAEVLVSLYSAKPAPSIKVPAVLLRIPQLWYPSIDPSELYEATRGWWVVSTNRVENAEIAFAVSRGIIREVYRVDSWRAQGPRDRGYQEGGGKRKRHGFEGHIAGAEFDRWRNTSVRHLFPAGSANPVRYVGC